MYYEFDTKTYKFHTHTRVHIHIYTHKCNRCLISVYLKERLVKTRYPNIKRQVEKGLPQE